jgi:glycosyltransferase involved in cell wall biosynthesis
LRCFFELHVAKELPNALRMRILFLNSYSGDQDDAERLVSDTSSELLARDHTVSVVAANDDRRAPNPEFWPSKMNRYYVPELMIPLTDRYNYNRFRRTSRYRDTLRYLEDIINIEKPDIIHVHNFPRIEVLKAIRTSVPIIRTIHDYENLCGNQLKRFPDGSICTEKLGPACKANCAIPTSFKATRVRAENRMMKKQFKRLIALSSYIRDVLVTNGFPADRITVLNNFTRLLPKPLDVMEDNVVLYAGRITPEKGLLELIQSISLTKARPKLVVVGKDGMLGQSGFQQKVVETAAHRGVEIQFLGWCAGDDLVAAYQRAKIVAFSSVWPEPFGLVGIEAMMQARPVVAFDCGGVPDWLQHGKTGFLVPHLDIRQFAYCLDQLIINDGLRRAMGEEAQECALKNFTAAAHMLGLLNIYTEVVNDNLTNRPGGCSPARDDGQSGGVST